jgi:putative membrane protein
MINYNPKEWFTFIFQIHKADTFRKLLPLMFAVSVYAGLVAYLELEYWQLSESSHVKNLNLMHSILGFVISLLLVFKTVTLTLVPNGRVLCAAVKELSFNTCPLAV